MSAAAESRAGQPVAGRARRLLRGLVTAPILAYSRFVSPAIPRRCKYEPTCSRYAVDALREYGIIKGLVLAGWRLLRCNPWSHGGFDPVAAQRVFRTRSGETRLSDAESAAPSPATPARTTKTRDL